MRAPPHLGWLAFASATLAAAVWACSAQPRSFTEADAETAPAGATPTETAPPTRPDEPDRPLPPPAPLAELEPTEKNLKVAFIGDTGTGDDFKQVLQLIKREGADLVMVQGDLNYAFLGRAQPWFDVIDREIDVPYLVAKGNHDIDWGGYAAGLETRMARWGLAPSNGSPTKENYSIVYKGLRLVMVSDDETTPSRAAYVQQQLVPDRHVWRVCAWHKNQRAANIGPKGDEMGWAVYENCRASGAIVAQAHSHTYSRSKTLTSDRDQIVDGSCPAPFALCVGNGRHFFFDSSVGGEDLRAPDTSALAMEHWAATQTGSFGALFLEFHVGGDPLAAEGYFMTTTNTILDPPPTSGLRRFSIRRTP